jgi:hypothetical protein
MNSFARLDVAHECFRIRSSEYDFKLLQLRIVMFLRSRTLASRNKNSVYWNVTSLRTVRTGPLRTQADTMQHSVVYRQALKNIHGKIIHAFVQCSECLYLAIGSAVISITGPMKDGNLQGHLCRLFVFLSLVYLYERTFAENQTIPWSP